MAALRDDEKTDSGLTKSQRNQYYKKGFKRLGEIYVQKTFINQNEKTELRNWIENGEFLTDASLKNEVLRAVPRQQTE